MTYTYTLTFESPFWKGRVYKDGVLVNTGTYVDRATAEIDATGYIELQTIGYAPAPVPVPVPPPTPPIVPINPDDPWGPSGGGDGWDTDGGSSGPKDYAFETSWDFVDSTAWAEAGEGWTNRIDAWSWGDSDSWAANEMWSFEGWSSGSELSW